MFFSAAAGDVVESSQTVIWATKPQLFSDATRQVGRLDNDDLKLNKPLHVSIMAGSTLSTFERALKEDIFGNLDIGTARVMPNVGMKVGAGCAGKWHLLQELTTAKRLCDYCFLCPHSVHTWQRKHSGARRGST